MTKQAPRSPCDSKRLLARIKELFEYDEKKGILIRKVHLCSNAKIGDIVGTDNGARVFVSQC